MLLQITPIELPQAEGIAVLVAAIIALSLALRSALGPTVMYLTEVVKSAYPIREGAGGLVALGMSLLLGGLLGLMAGLTAQTTPGELGLYVCIGLFAGLFVASGAVESYKASATINTKAASAIEEVKTADEAEKASTKKETSAQALAQAAKELQAQARASRPVSIGGMAPRPVDNIITTPRVQEGSIGSAMSETQPEGGIAGVKAAGPVAGDSCDITP